MDYASVSFNANRGITIGPGGGTINVPFGLLHAGEQRPDRQRAADQDGDRPVIPVRDRRGFGSVTIAQGTVRLSIANGICLSCSLLNVTTPLISTAIARAWQL